MRKIGVGLLVAIAFLAGFGWSRREAILMRLPGIVGRIVDPIGENVRVVWERAPEGAPVVATGRT